MKKSKLWLLVLSLIPPIIVYSISPKPISKDVYQVEVKVKVGNCSSTVIMTVDAFSSFEARDKAEILAKFRMSSKAGKTTKLKR